MSNYYRITGYCEKNDFSFIIDCYGCYEKLWQFSAFLISKGLNVLEVGNDDKFLDGNIQRADEDKEQLILRANAPRKPQHITVTVDGTAYKAVQVADKFYIPDRTKTA